MFRLAPLLHKILRQVNTKAAAAAANLKATTTTKCPQLLASLNGGATSTSSSSTSSIGIWWASLSGMTYLTLCVGGLTRLSESGLSMTNWSIVNGMKPPLSESEWSQEFEEYKKYPEYNHKLSDGEFGLQHFKSIFWPEYIHRMLGRCVGLLFFLPLPLVLKSPNLRTSKRRIAAIAALIVSQGLYGWYMVKSGLEVNDDQVPRVSHYRLATHFLLASLLFLLSLKESAIHLLSNKINNNRQLLSLCATQSLANASRRSLRFTQATFWTVFATSLLGCLVAGLDAGLVYNTWPKMDNKFLPWHLIGENGSFFSDPATVQILHRFVAYTAFIKCHRLFFLNRKTFSNIPALRNFSLAILALVYVQLLLGIASLHSNVKVWIASLHQVNSLNLLGTIFLSLFI